MTNSELVEKLILEKTLKTPKIINAFRKINRKNFVLPEDQDKAYEDRPLPIGYEATISQPTTVAFMLEKLKARRRDKIMEIGTGSGYETALLAEIVGPRGKIYSIEYVPELKEFAQNNLMNYNFKNIKLFVGDGKIGLRKFAPFDRIISSASGQEIPKSWKRQLKIGGRIIAPVGNNLVLLEKISERKFKEESYPGFVFVVLK